MMGISGYAGIGYDRYAYMPGAMGRTEGVDAVGNRDARVSSPENCQTCKNRKYVDGSNEADVSFKAPAHISPENSASMVMAHEQMHVANARQEDGKENAELVSSSVRLKTAVCPECGTAYVAGGVTSTTMKYTESNPYERNRKFIEGSLLKGSYISALV